MSSRSIVVVLGLLCLTSGNAVKYFDAVLAITISTTLLSYLLIYPAVWKLRSSPTRTSRARSACRGMKPLTVLLVVLVAVAAVQLIAPGARVPLVQQRLRAVRLVCTATGTSTC